jgi:hypothetical protein
VIINQFDRGGFTFGKAKNHAPVGPNRDCPESFEFALQRMQPQAWDIEIFAAPMKDFIRNNRREDLAGALSSPK